MPVPREWLDRAADALDALTESAREAARARLEAISYADVALAREAAIEVISRYSLGLSEAAAVMSAEMYDAVREESVGERLGADAVPGYDREATDRAVRGMIQGVADGDPPDSFIGKCLDRISWEGQRAFARTTVENGRRDPLKPRFARVPAPGCTCRFCLMLASRGAAYSSEYEAGGNGNHYHAHCRCRVVPCFGGKVDVEGYDPDEIWASIQEDEDYEKFEDYMRRRAKRLVDANRIRDRRRQLAKRGWTQGRIDEEVAPLEEEFRLKYGKDYSDVKRKASKSASKAHAGARNEEKPKGSLRKQPEMEVGAAYNNIYRERDMRVNEGSLNIVSKQNKHIKGTSDWEAARKKAKTEGKHPRSYFVCTEDELSTIIYKKIGFGDAIGATNGKWAGKERCTADSYIGVFVDYETGEEIVTDSFIIHYSKKGIHAIPCRPRRKK